MGLEQFKAFAKGYEKKENQNKAVWIYTRVSSKDQEANKSLRNQEESAMRLAAERNFLVTNKFGGTYESASGDFTRKEFTKLFNEVKAAKNKPYAILLNTISRFSRTGGSGISLAHQLVDQLGVNLIEIVSGKSTETEDGKLEIYRGLIAAKQENIDRLKITIPGMIKFLEEGNWLGVVPRGYDHFGPRVKGAKYSIEQRIIINKEGSLLKLAWQWKLQGERDCFIAPKLEEMGLSKVTKQFLSQMWRNPFYCGVLVNQMLNGRVVQGKWEKMVSEQDFLMVQEIVKGNNQGYKQDKASPERPLNSFIKCSNCDGKFAGYEVKKKRVHYYKCQKCKGISINANTTAHAKAVGAHDLFVNYLEMFSLKQPLADLFKAQLKLTYETLNGESKSESIHLQKQVNEVKEKLKNLNMRYATDMDFDKELYRDMKKGFEVKITELVAELEKSESTISNLDNYIEISETVARNISKHWVLGGLETKKRIQELVFKDGLSLDVQNRTYLTKNVNFAFELSAELSMVSEDKKEKRQLKNQLPSSVVAGVGLEPTTFGL